ncbi:MAG: hypothetical protein K6G09_07015 [Treponema sp.]|nr:hypothetical protein [Treponema sp.]
MKIKRLFIAMSFSSLIFISGCDKEKPLPASSPDPTSMFGVDRNINIMTIDNYLGRSDVAYRDMRMLFDPADYVFIGGNPDLDATIKGFKIVPYPFLASLSELPVKGAYKGNTLYTLTWDSFGNIETATANYDESLMILEDLFPKDKVIFLMCGGGGYAGMTKALLIKLGWDESKLYNIGGNWAYQGKNSYEIIKYAENPNEHNIFATWRADYAYIDFSKLHKK